MSPPRLLVTWGSAVTSGVLASFPWLLPVRNSCRRCRRDLVDVDGVGLAPLLLALPALGALTLKLLDLLFVRLGGHAAAEGLLPGEEGGVSSCDFVSAAALGGMPPPGPKAFFLDESSAPSDQTHPLPNTSPRALGAAATRKFQKFARDTGRALGAAQIPADLLCHIIVAVAFEIGQAQEARMSVTMDTLQL